MPAGYLFDNKTLRQLVGLHATSRDAESTAFRRLFGSFFVLATDLADDLPLVDGDVWWAVFAAWIRGSRGAPVAPNSVGDDFDINATFRDGRPAAEIERP